MPLENPQNQKVIARVMTVAAAVETIVITENVTTSILKERRRETLEMSVQMLMNVNLYIRYTNTVQNQIYTNEFNIATS